MIKHITAFTLFLGVATGSIISATALANDLHERSIVIDTHSDFLYRADAENTALDDDSETAQTSLQKLKHGGVDAQFFSVWVPQAYEEYGYARKTLEFIDQLYLEVAKHPNDIEMAYSVADIRRLESEGKIAALMGIEGGYSIENRLELLRNYYRLGVRYMTLTWSFTTDWADSSGDGGRWGGLTDFGVDVVREMNRLGMMVDISHASDDTFWDVMGVTTAPVIASHSSVRAINDQSRNMNDEMIKAVAKNGGVIQINFYAYFLDQAFADAVDVEFEKSSAQWKTLGKQYLNDPIGFDLAEWEFYREVEGRVDWPALSVLVDHIDHVVQLVGPEHVGLGSDFDGVTSLPIGLEHQGKMPILTKALQDKGYSDQHITMILGGNLLRVMTEVEAVAAKNR
ncbi:MAG: dipeptidase [Halioglobus sp.]